MLLFQIAPPCVAVLSVKLQFSILVFDLELYIAPPCVAVLFMKLQPFISAVALLYIPIAPASEPNSRLIAVLFVKLQFIIVAFAQYSP